MKAVVSLGSNIEPRADYLRRAVEALAALPKTRFIRRSSVRETEPVEVPGEFAGQKFLNMAAVFESALPADEFSRRMHRVEDALGRVRGVRNGPRTIDIDLISYGGIRSIDRALTLPHPRAHEREFVLAPLREMALEELRRRYNRYVDGYRDEDGALPEMMSLKYLHTMEVVRNAELIARGEGFTDAQRFAALASSLLHDTGRYEQLRRFDTFKDSESVDHAVFSHEIIRDGGWLAESCLHQVAPEYSEAILNAVLYHNRRDLPEGMDELTAIAAHTVRDADKLDIFRVLEDRVEHSDWRKDSRAFWNLELGRAPSPEIVDAIRSRRPCDYQHIRSLADFVLIQIGWMHSGLHFAVSRRLCAERGHLEFRRRFLREIGGGPVADEICNLIDFDRPQTGEI